MADNSELEAKATPTGALKQLIKTLADFTALISSITQGFSFSEVKELIALASELPETIKDAPAMLSQYLGLDDESRAELISYVAQNVTFQSDLAVQEGIQTVLDAAVAMSKVFQIFKQ